MRGRDLDCVTPCGKSYTNGLSRRLSTPLRSFFGAGSGGARFYFKILLALAAFLIIANQKVTERDCKWILILMVVGSFLDLAKTMLFYRIFGGSEYFVDPLENYTWQQQLAVAPLIVVLILFSRYRTGEILNVSKIWSHGRFRSGRRSGSRGADSAGHCNVPEKRVAIQSCPQWLTAGS